MGYACVEYHAVAQTWHRVIGHSCALNVGSFFHILYYIVWSLEDARGIVRKAISVSDALWSQSWNIPRKQASSPIQCVARLSIGCSMHGLHASVRNALGLLFSSEQERRSERTDNERRIEEGREEINEACNGRTRTVALKRPSFGGVVANKRPTQREGQLHAAALVERERERRLRMESASSGGADY